MVTDASPRDRMCRKLLLTSWALSEVVGSSQPCSLPVPSLWSWGGGLRSQEQGTGPGPLLKRGQWHAVRVTGGTLCGLVAFVVRGGSEEGPLQQQQVAHRWLRNVTPGCCGGCTGSCTPFCTRVTLIPVSSPRSGQHSGSLVSAASGPSSLEADPGLAATGKEGAGLPSPGLPGGTLPGKGLSTRLVSMGEVGCSDELRCGCPSQGREEEGKGWRAPGAGTSWMGG